MRPVSTIIICLLLVGCSSKTYLRETFDPANNITTKTKVSVVDFLMKTNAEDVIVNIDGDKRSLFIGDLSQVPDANSIKAITEGVVEGISSVIKGGI